MDLTMFNAMTPEKQLAYLGKKVFEATQRINQLSQQNDEMRSRIDDLERSQKQGARS